MATRSDRSLAAAAAGRRRPDVDAIAELSFESLQAMLEGGRGSAVAALSDWLVRRARDPILASTYVAELCARLVETGMPLDRFGSSTETLNAEHDAIARLWVRGSGVTERTHVRPLGADDSPAYLASPYYAAAVSGRWVDLWLPDAADDAFEIVPELKADGFVHYLCIGITLVSEARGWFTFATRSPDGFSAADVATIALLLPSLSLTMEMRSSWASLKALLRTYVGTDPQAAILHGRVKRGEVTTIRSAMLFADMRNSVGRTADLSVVDAVAVFNAFFDCLVPPIESRGGEVLKYLGDGLLAIFRDAEDAGDAAERALAAGVEALDLLRRYNASQGGAEPIQAGVALHYGEAAYGNVGSGVRLDFTVIGRDVALASRIAGMNRGLDEPILMSGAFTERLGGAALPLGTYPVRGLADPVALFRPAAGEGS